MRAQYHRLYQSTTEFRGLLRVLDSDFRDHAILARVQSFMRSGIARIHFTAKSCKARSSVRRLWPRSSTSCEENSSRSVSTLSSRLSDAVVRCWYGSICDTLGDVSIRRHGHGASRCQHGGLVCAIDRRSSVFMLLIQISAKELAAPGMHGHEANASRELTTTPDRAN